MAVIKKSETELNKTQAFFKGFLKIFPMTEPKIYASLFYRKEPTEMKSCICKYGLSM